MIFALYLLFFLIIVLIAVIVSKKARKIVGNIFKIILRLAKYLVNITVFIIVSVLLVGLVVWVISLFPLFWNWLNSNPNQIVDKIAGLGAALCIIILVFFLIVDFLNIYFSK
jgi:hypothetical protein